MRKAIILPLIVMMSLLTSHAQTKDQEELSKKLPANFRKDTSRVNQLNQLATNVALISAERKKYATEALSIARKTGYTLGQGYAFMLLGSIYFNEEMMQESNQSFQLADSIFRVTKNPELGASLRWRMTSSAATTAEKELLFSEADSLAKRSGNFELQVNVLLRWAALKTDAGDKETLLQQADSLARQSGNFELQANLLHNRARNIASTDNKKALNYILQTEDLTSKSGNLVLISEYQRHIASFYDINLSDYAKAMEYYLKSIRSAENANNLYAITTGWVQLGGLYATIGDHENALKYFQKAETANKKLNDNNIEAVLQNNIGESHRLTGNYDEAIRVYKRGLEVTRQYNYVETYESNLADVYTSMDSLSQAFRYGFSSLKSATENESPISMTWAQSILSRAYLKNKMPDSALYFARLGLEIAEQLGNLEYLRDNNRSLAEAYAYKKDYEKAYNYHLQYIKYRDSMMNAEVRNKTAVQQYSFNLENKEMQISALHAQKKAQKNLLTGAIILLLLIVATAFLLWRNVRQKQKANRLLKKQKLEIDNKASELAKQKEILEKSYRNIELLGEIGRKITSSLSVEKIISTAYANVNSLMDANVFGIGIYNEASRKIEFPATYEEGKPLPFYVNSVDDKNRFAAICFTSGNEILIGNLNKEYQDYLQNVPTPHEGEQPLSLIFIPLVAKGNKLGVITVQSFHENAYSDNHLFMLRNIAVYAAIALENAESYEALNQTVITLKQTQSQLIHSEKMASLGELTAGIAHEIQNPLNFVNNFSEVSAELIEEMNQVIDKGELEEAKSIAGDVKQNLEKIRHHGKRADEIVKGMLQHSRTSSGQKEPTNINALCDEYLRLAYHGLRAKDKLFNAKLETNFDESIGKINVLPQEMGRVILNLINNAFYTVDEKKKSGIASDRDDNYEPAVSIITKKNNGRVEICISDNGYGIPDTIKEKIFQPFFTTKPTGQGTGLGLSLSYDIVKAHGGELSIRSEAGKGSVFIIHLNM